MKVSELIEILFDIQNEIGDLEVVLIASDESGDLFLDDNINFEFFGEDDDNTQTLGLTSLILSDEDEEPSEDEKH